MAATEGSSEGDAPTQDFSSVTLRSPLMTAWQMLLGKSRQLGSFLSLPIDAAMKPLAELRPPVIVEAAKHTTTCIMLHGCYCEGDMFESMPQILNELGGDASGTRFVFPNAPLRTIDWPDGIEQGVSAWYNYFTSKGGTMDADADEIDEVHLHQVTRAMHALLDEEAELLGGNTTRIAIGGNSQGGTVALHAALSYPRPLGAVLLGCTVLMRMTRLPAVQPRSLPVFVFTVEKDQEYVPQLQKRCYDRLRAVGYAVVSHVEPGQDHYNTSIAELHHTAAWLSGALHGKALRVKYRDVPEAKGPLPSLFAFEL